LWAKTSAQEEHGWNGKAFGSVIVTREGDNVLLFAEKGSWLGRGVSFSNALRWTIDRQGGTISLEHLRRGATHPVFLFHLALSGERSMASVDAHLCQNDAYFGEMHWDRYRVQLRCRAIGPSKNDEMQYEYT